MKKKIKYEDFCYSVATDGEFGCLDCETGKLSRIDDEFSSEPIFLCDKCQHIFFLDDIKQDFEIIE
jgi:hypothetical protein